MLSSFLDRRTLAITGLARVIVHVKNGRSPAPMHCFVSICVLLRFCHAQSRCDSVEHLFHAQLKPSSTFMRLSGYDTSRPTASAMPVLVQSRFRSLQRHSANADRLHRFKRVLSQIKMQRTLESNQAAIHCRLRSEIHPCQSVLSVVSNAIQFSRAQRSATKRSHDINQRYKECDSSTR